MNSLKTKKIVFIITVILFMIINIFCYSNKYDILARYQYDDINAHNKIKENLNYEEISYIIEYAIDPTQFIDMIDNPNFNIYNIEQYHELSNKYWQLTNYDACTLYEVSLKTNFNYESYIENNYHGIIIHYLNHGDPYYPDSTLIKDPTTIDLFLNYNNTISILDNTNLHKIPLNITNNKDIYIDNRVIDDLMGMCNAISKDLITNNCGNLQVINGYQSYSELEEIYNDAINNNYDINDYEAPGHSEHQLGLAIDFKVKDVNVNNFNKTIQYNWLKNNAYKYGFIFTYTEDTIKDTKLNPQLNHLRYVGKYNSKIMIENNYNLKELNNE